LLAAGIAAAGSAILSETTVALPLDDAPMLTGISFGRVRFFAEGAPPRADRVLRGCSELEVESGVAGSVTLLLDWRCATIGAGDASCADGGIEAGPADAAGLDQVVRDRTGADLVGIDLAQTDRVGTDLARSDATGTDLAQPDSAASDRAGTDRQARDARVIDAVAQDVVPGDSPGSERATDAGGGGWDRALPDGCSGVDITEYGRTAVNQGSMQPVFGGAVVEDNGWMHLIWVTDNVSRTLNHYYDAAGETNDIEIVDEAAGSQSALALDALGGLHTVYLRSGIPNQLRYASGTYHSWSTVDVPETTVGGEDVAIAVDGRGLPHIAYVESSGDDFPGYAHFNGTDWDVYPVNEVYGWGGLSIAVDAQDRPYLAYRDSNDRLKVAMWAVADWNITTVDASSVNSGFSLTVDRDQQPHMVYTPTLDDTLWHAVYLADQWWSIEIWDVPGKSSATSLVIDQANRPHIGHTDTVADDVFYTRWTGTRWCTQLVDHDDDVWGKVVVVSKGNVLYLFSFSLRAGNPEITTRIRY
jgi:hypothetical protein